MEESKCVMYERERKRERERERKRERYRQRTREIERDKKKDCWRYEILQPLPGNLPSTRVTIAFILQVVLLFIGCVHYASNMRICNEYIRHLERERGVLCDVCTMHQS